MNSLSKTHVAIIGSGIVGLSFAYFCAQRGLRVSVFEKNSYSLGASIRNFGLIWLTGQNNEYLSHAIRSREIWMELSKKIPLWMHTNGSLGLAQSYEEETLLREFFDEKSDDLDGLNWVDKNQLISRYPAVHKNVRCGLFNPLDASINSREAIESLAAFLSEYYKVKFHYSTSVVHVETSQIYSSSNSWHADVIFICPGSDYQTLKESLLGEHELTLCQLQMMKTQPINTLLNYPALYSGLSMLQYQSFHTLPSFKSFYEYFLMQYPKYLSCGIHVLIAQNNYGELIIGDSHEYSQDPDGFFKEEIKNWILDYTRTMIDVPKFSIKETWLGIYSISPDGIHIKSPIEDVHVITGFGGKGMTTSFSIAEQYVTKIFQ